MVPLSFGCGSAVFAAIATLAPSRAARSAIASPMPRLPPDTNSVLPLRDVIRVTPTCIRKGRDVFFTSPYGRGSTPTSLPLLRPITLTIRAQQHAAGFRQREGGEEEYAVSGDGKDRNRVGK